MAPLSLNPPPVMLRTLDIKASFRICMQDYRGLVLVTAQDVLEVVTKSWHYVTGMR